MGSEQASTGIVAEQQGLHLRVFLVQHAAVVLIDLEPALHGGPRLSYDDLLDFALQLGATDLLAAAAGAPVRT